MGGAGEALQASENSELGEQREPQLHWVSDAIHSRPVQPYAILLICVRQHIICGVSCGQQLISAVYQRQVAPARAKCQRPEQAAAKPQINEQPLVAPRGFLLLRAHAPQPHERRAVEEEVDAKCKHLQRHDAT